MQNLAAIFITTLTLAPTIAKAEWAPSPTQFSFETAFVSCTANPTVDECGTESLATCALPFEDRGLPAFGAQIAESAGCDHTALEDLPTDTLMSPDHCVSIASDILSDEGAVPLETGIECSHSNSECVILAGVQHQHWQLALVQLDNGPSNDPTSRDLLGRIIAECAETSDASNIENAALRDKMSIDCASTGMAQLWRDLIAEN